MNISPVEEFLHVPSYLLLESKGFAYDIFGGVVKMSSSTLLENIFHLHQRTKNLLKYVHTNPKYGHLVTIPYSDTRE